MLDTIQIIFWTITYLLIIAAGIKGWKEKKISIPYIPAILNFSWELCAMVQSNGFYGHVLWFSLDCIIIVFNFCFLNSTKKRIIYVISILIALYMQNYIFTVNNGMLIMSFIMDLIMAICFCSLYKKISGNFKISIAITKWIGSALAGIYYANQSSFVAITAIIVFICNLFYLSLCLGETEKQEKYKLHKK